MGSVLEAMKYRVVIAEDDLYQRQFLINTIGQFADLELIEAVSSGDRLIQSCKKNFPDIILLDIGLHKRDGISAAKEIFAAGLKPQIIVITGKLSDNNMESSSMKSVLLTGFELNFVGFLMKPFDENKLINAIEEAKHRVRANLLSAIDKAAIQHTNVKWIKYVHNFREYEIAEEMIMYVEKIDKYVSHIYLSDNQVLQTKTTLTELLSQCSYNVFRSHKSFIVNLKYVKTVSSSKETKGGYDIELLTSSASIPLSKKLYGNYLAAKDQLEQGYRTGEI